MSDLYVPCAICGEPTSTLKQAIRYTRVTHVKHAGCHQATEPPPPSIPQRRALIALAQAGVPRGLHPSTRKALLAHGWVRPHESVLIITAAGRRALDRLPPAEVRFLAKKSGYTTDPARAVDPLEVVDDATLTHFTADAREREAGLPGRRAEAARRRLRTLGERGKRLTSAGVDISPALEQLERHLQQLERRDAA